MVMQHRISHFGMTSFLLLALIVGATGQARNYSIQVAAIENRNEAEAMVEALNAKGLESYLVVAEIAGLGTRYRIRIGRYKSQAEARTMAAGYKKSGLIDEFFIAAYEPPSEQTTRKRRAVTTGEKVIEKAPAETRAPEKEAAVKEPDPKPAAEVKAAQPEPPVVEEARDEMVETAPRIAGPPMADALTDLKLENSNWKPYRTLSEHNLRSIYFVDALTGWVAGDEGSVFRTTDGGMTWKPLISGTGADLNLIRFIDWNTGWMIGNPEKTGYETATADSDKVLLLTSDGGRSWRQKRLPHVTSLYFIDARTGWAVGRNATVLRTTDGGEEWEPLNDLEKIIGLPVESTTYNYGFSDIYFLDAEHGWMTGNFYGRERNNIGGLYATTDGGRTWKRIPLTFQTQYSSGRFTPGLLHSVRFSDQQTGSVIGEMMDGEGRFFFALHTRDGGRTWQQFRTPTSATHCTQFIDLENGWTAAFAPREGSAEAVIYDTALMKTDNGGLSWQNEFLALGRRIRGIFFLSPNRGWAVGDRGIILKYEISRK